jgi:hypothetical protein
MEQLVAMKPTLLTDRERIILSGDEAKIVKHIQQNSEDAANVILVMAAHKLPIGD